MTEPLPLTLRGDALWGAKMIAAFLDCTEEKIYALQHEAGCPIRKVGGQLFARRTALLRWIESKAA